MTRLRNELHSDSFHAVLAWSWGCSFTGWGQAKYQCFTATVTVVVYCLKISTIFFQKIWGILVLNDFVACWHRKSNVIQLHNYTNHIQWWYWSNIVDFIIFFYRWISLADFFKKSNQSRHTYLWRQYYRRISCHYGSTLCRKYPSWFWHCKYKFNQNKPFGA